jgi:uncharacterized membrane protein
MKSCCGGSTNGNKRQRTGADCSESKERDHLSFKTVAVIFLAIAAIAALFYYISHTDKGGSSLSEGLPGEAHAAVTPVTTKNEVVFPESAFADGKARFFEYKTPEGKVIKYFVIKSSDGVIRAAFDACDVCWEAGKGYFQKDDFMVCRNCGRRFQSTKVNVVTGGCNPSALTRNIKDGKVIIPVQALDEGKKFFK